MKWIFIPLIVIGLIIAIILFFYSGKDEKININELNEQYNQGKSERVVDEGYTYWVDSGTLITSGGSNLVNLAKPVNHSKSFILTNMFGSNNIGANELGAYTTWVNDTAFTLTNGGVAGPLTTYQWYVIEGEDFNVQYGNLSYQAGSGLTTYDITINSTVVNNSIPILSKGSCATTVYKELFAGANLTNSTNLQIIRQDDSCDGTISYYVVEFNDGTSIQRGFLNQSATSNDIVFNQVIKNQTWLYYNYYYDTQQGVGLDDVSLSVESINSTNYRFRRQVVSTLGVYVDWYVISNPTIFVQNGSARFNIQVNQTLTPIQYNSTFSTYSVNNSLTGANYGNHLGFSLIKNTTNLELRNRAGPFGTAHWESITFNPIPPVTPTGNCTPTGTSNFVVDGINCVYNNTIVNAGNYNVTLINGGNISINNTNFTADAFINNDVGNSYFKNLMPTLGGFITT